MVHLIISVFYHDYNQAYSSSGGKCTNFLKKTYCSIMLARHLGMNQIYKLYIEH